METHVYSPACFPTQLTKARCELKKNGIIFLKHIDSETTGEKLANMFGKSVHNLDAERNGITKITEEKMGTNPKNSLAFTRAGLIPHTDRSTIIKPPKFLLNWVQKHSIEGGETLLVDGKTLYEQLKKSDVKNLNLLSDKIAMFSDGSNSYISPIFINKNGIIIIRFRDDNCVFFSDEAKSAVDALRELIHKNTKTYDFEAGEGYLLNNTRWLHGRNAYNGHRVVCRIHLT